MSITTYTTGPLRYDKRQFFDLCCAYRKKGEPREALVDEFANGLAAAAAH